MSRPITIAALAAASATTVASAAPVVTFDFNGSTVAPATTGGVSATDFTFGPGFSQPTPFVAASSSNSGPLDSFLATSNNDTGINSTDLAESISEGDFVTFSVDADAGQTLDLESLDLDVQPAGNFNAAVDTIYLFASTDGFATTPTPADSLGSFSRGADFSFNTVDSLSFDLSDPAFDDVDSISFRIYASDRSDTDQDPDRGLILDNVVLDGTVSAIPEPASAAVIGVGLLGCLARRRR